MKMERFFNTAGPQTPDAYTIDPLTRFDLDDVLMLIRQQRYFVLHAPRQTGKTSCMLALRDLLDREGQYIAVYANVEGGQASRNDVQSVVKSTCDTLAEQFRGVLKSDLPLQILSAAAVRGAAQAHRPDSRRDRCPGRRQSGGHPPPDPFRLCRPSAVVPHVHHPLRCARCARLPHRAQ